MPPKDPNTRSTMPVKQSSAQRRAAEHSAVAGRQAELKQEAADRAAARAKREAEKQNAG